MKRILALDGGGIRGLFTVQILARIEQLFRQEQNRPDLVLADVFDLFAGTSTGAIIATSLCWGMSVAEVERLYVEQGAEMFTRSPWFRRLNAKYRADKLAQFFQQMTREDDAQNTPALLGTKKLRRLLLVVMRNATTGSAWPVSNHPHAKYNDPNLPDCNLRVPLWQLLRASTAAPTFYAPESIQFGAQRYLFVDGAITPFNNPALIAVLMATLPSYQLAWPASRYELHVVSIGTGGISTRLPDKLPTRINVLDHLNFVPAALMDSISVEQDLACRVLGDCLHGAQLDSDVGDLLGPNLLKPDEQKFTYVRYDTRLDVSDNATVPPAFTKAAMDDLTLIPTLQKIGRDYAAKNVRLEHLYPRECATVG
ncbi:MAG TPA: patatin-like phospholipase family protein [Pirellulales bacterium]|nr:patatin-like phospholipase family protein [Pirellulales bacterium]